VDFSQATSKFSFSAKFRDLLTYDNVIVVLICISSVNFYRVFQYKHFEVWLAVLWFTVLKIMTIFLSPTPKLSSGLSSERLTLWRYFWSYCRVTKSLPLLFCYARWSSSWKWRETSSTFFAHKDPFSDWTIRIICQCDGITYANMLHLAQLSSLSSRREELCRRIFNSITQPDFCLHTLLPPQRDPTIVTRLTAAAKYPRITTRTKTTSPSFLMH